MSDALEDHDAKVSIGGKSITNLRFADDIDALAEEEQELEDLIQSLDKTYQTDAKQRKGIQREIKVNSRSWIL